MWDPAQYSRFRDERSRPFFELIARIRHLEPRRIVDLGCGTGSNTEVLSDLWPDAEIRGIDHNEAMLERAKQIEKDKLTFSQGEIEQFVPSGEDLVLSNAALHWIDEHESLILKFAKGLPPGGTFAFQVPANFDAPSHAILRKLTQGSEWRHLLDDPKRHAYSRSAVEYARMLLNHGFEVDAWETNYVQVLPGEDAVFEWMAGTTLRPIYAALTDRQEERFSEQYRAQLRAAYPTGAAGTVYEFKRVFVVARAPQTENGTLRAKARASEVVGVGWGLGWRWPRSSRPAPACR